MERASELGGWPIMATAFAVLALATLPWTWYCAIPIGTFIFGSQLIRTFRYGGGIELFLSGSFIVSMVLWFVLSLALGNQMSLAIMSVATCALASVELIRKRRTALQGLGRLRLSIRTVASVILVVVMITAVWTAVSPYEGDALTEFFILNDEGLASDYPSIITINQSAPVFLGLNNHEGRETRYEIQIWLSENKDPLNILNTSSMMYLGNKVVTLPDQPYPEMEEWEPQYLTEYPIEIPFVGGYKIWFVLFINGAPSTYSGLAPWSEQIDRDGLPLLRSIQSGQLIALSLNIEVTT